jgi:hypothetical protein
VSYQRLGFWAVTQGPPDVRALMLGFVGTGVKEVLHGRRIF